MSSEHNAAYIVWVMDSEEGRVFEPWTFKTKSEAAEYISDLLPETTYLVTAGAYEVNKRIEIEDGLG